MKIDKLWVKIFGGIALLNAVFWLLSATTSNFSNALTNTKIFTVYIFPAFLPVAPWLDTPFDNSTTFLVIFGIVVLTLLPLFWSLVAYGVVRVAKFSWGKMK